ncbi:MAG: CinA family nicotinamide mononucleotide deamidase-related protein [Saprospiraceae bacterium]|nr:CinA family nicotinamide mononucleotide deamidase-related protein [Saprospiraceae bacterium]
MDTIKKAAILTIGDELMIGQITDTNSVWIASFLDLHGWQVTRKMGVRDDIPQIIEGISICLDAADLLITTGGLGPTNDDLTVDALCQYFGCKKVWHEETWQRVIEILKRFGREPAEMHKLQCYQPDAADIIPNDQGSAPGIVFQKNNKIVVSVPGVPNEMKHLLKDKIIHLLPKGNPVEHRFIRTAGEGETVLASMIEDIEAALPADIKLAYLPNFSQVTLRLTSYGEDNQNKLDSIQQQMIERLGNLVYGTGDTNLSKAIGGLLRERNETIGTAESCTGGYASHLITSVPGSSDYYLGSVIPYAYELKTALLDISEDMLNTYGAVSEEVVTAMAEGVRRKLNVTWSIATSGIAGPGGATPQKPVGTIWIACSGPNGTRTKLLKLTRDRLSNIEYAAIASLVLLRKMMIEEKG